jgi:hypothetical protein
MRSNGRCGDCSGCWRSRLSRLLRVTCLIQSESYVLEFRIALDL